MLDRLTRLYTKIENGEAALVSEEMQKTNLSFHGSGMYHVHSQATVKVSDMSTIETLTFVVDY